MCLDPNVRLLWFCWRHELVLHHIILGKSFGREGRVHSDGMKNELWWAVVYRIFELFLQSDNSRFWNLNRFIDWDYFCELGAHVLRQGVLSRKIVSVGFVNYLSRALGLRLCWFHGVKLLLRLVDVARGRWYVQCLHTRIVWHRLARALRHLRLAQS